MATERKGLRRVFSIAELSTDLTLPPLTLDDEDLQWRTGNCRPAGVVSRPEESNGRRISQDHDSATTLSARRLSQSYPSLLQAAGVDLGPLVMLKAALRGRSDGLEVRYEADTGMLLAMDVPLRAEKNVWPAVRGQVLCSNSLCPRRSPPQRSRCRLATEVKAVARELARDLFSPAAARIRRPDRSNPESRRFSDY